jgi:Ti-type conjugative transfer relaxase TraA
MAIYHFSAKVIGRSGGRSVVASAAYRAGERLHEQAPDLDHDYTAKQGVVHSEIMLPKGAPDRWRPADDTRDALRVVRERLWNEVEVGEKRKDAQLARDIEISLPRELGKAEAVRLVRDFVQEQFVARGMVADLNVHWTQAGDGGEQPHAHVMLTMRRLEPVQKLAGEKVHGGEADRERHPGRGSGGAPGVTEDPGIDGGAEQRRSDRADPAVATVHPQQSAHDADPVGDHRAASRLARVIAVARLRAGLQRREAEQAQEIGFGPKETAWNDRALLTAWRERWASMVNERLCEMGHDARVDHRSYAEQGIPLAPQHKIGPVGTYQDRDRQLERAAEHRAIARRNGEALEAEPGIALRALTHQQSTFTRQDLARFVNRHTDGAEQFATVLARVEAAPELVRLGGDGRGRSRFTTREMLDTEARMERAADGMSGRDRHRVLQAAGWRAEKAAERDGLQLGDEQRAAYRHVTSGPDLALVVGFAGTGKSAMLGVARRAWEAEGYTVRGAALSGIAAEGLEGGSGIASRTIASLEYAWKEGRDQLTSRDVLVVDEAGMVGSRQMERVLSAVRAAGAKVVLVGDPEQLQAIEAGAAFRALAERHGAAEITTVRRQREPWQQDATRELATGRTADALERYRAAGMVVAAATREAARAALVEGWDLVRQQSPQASQVILAYTRDDVRVLNELARDRMREAGALGGADQVVQTERGERAFAAGDRIMFQRNERGLGGDGQGRGGVAVKNGTLGTVLAVEAGGERLTVRLDGAGGSAGKAGQMVTFTTKDYAHLDHGYAATVHKAQGVTVDRAHVLATPHLDRHAAYVGLTRHRDGVTLHYGRDDFAEPARLARTLGRERAKDTTLDYDREDELVRRYAERRGLAPDSSIVVRPASVLEPERERVAPRPSRFAGLKLGTNRPARAAASLPEPVLVARPPSPPAPQLNHEELAMAGYAQAWSDAERMRQAGLPMLPHQEAALGAASRRLDASAPNLARDVGAALASRPALAAGAGTLPGVQALGVMVAAERRERLQADERGRAAVRTWDGLEREYEAAGKVYEWDAQREVGTRMEAFAKALKLAPELEGVLRERGRALGIAEGSRLDQVVQAPEIDWRLLRRLDIDHGSRMRSGPSLGM